MQNLGDLFCPICFDYFSKPITAVCGHSFCEYCIEQYFLHFDECPLCQSAIRKQKLHRANALSNFTQNFISSQFPSHLPEYKARADKLQEYKDKKSLSQFSTGMAVDIRDSEYRWRLGRIIRIISRVGQFHKFVKVQYVDCEEKVEEEVKVVSERLAKAGFYTARDDLPKFVDKAKGKSGSG